jgi:iron complex transport system ATP-binding protein
MGTFGMKHLLRTEALTVGHGRNAVVRGVRLAVEPGQLVALIGMNGSGKSTLLRTLAGLLPPLEGKVLLGEQPLHGMSAMQRARHTAVVLTGRPELGLLDVRTLVTLGRQPWTGHMGRLTAADEAKVDEALKLTGTSYFPGRSLDSLSDGERQKVMIARAVAQDTPLLLLDEPTAFLDLVNRVQVMRLLRHIAHDLGKGVLLSTHDLRTALDLADLIVIVHAGVVWSGTPQEAVGTGTLASVFNGSGLVFDPVSGTLR